jgi:integrase
MAKNKKTLNDRTIKGLKPKAERYDVLDAACPGLAVRVSPTGKKVYVLIARYPANPKAQSRRTLAQVGEISLLKVREKARHWLALIRAGVDPAEEEERERLAEQKKRQDTFGVVAEAYIKFKVIGPKGDEEHPLQRKGKETARDIRNELIARWGKRPIANITAADVNAVIEAAILRGAPYQAHNLLGHVRRVFSWAIAKGEYGLDRSPVDRMRPKDVIGRKKLRTRALDEEKPDDPKELRAFWRATETMAYPYGPLFQMLALTGLRKSEVAEARWIEFDLARQRWVIPAARMKARPDDAKEHYVPLTPDVIAILTSLPRFNGGDFLFSTTNGAKPVDGFSKAKAKLDREMLIELRKAVDDPNEREKVTLKPFKIHDIRRTVRTGLAKLEIPFDIAERVLAHARPVLEQTYNVFSYEKQKREALTKWAAHVQALVSPPPDDGKVVRLR